MKCFVLKLSAVLPEFSLGDLFKLKVSSPGKRRGLQIIKHITPHRLLIELTMGRINVGQISVIHEAWIGKDKDKDKHKVNDKDKWE